MEFYNEILVFSNRWGCSVNEAFAFAVASFTIFLALFGWSISFFMDLGDNLYVVTKKFFTLLRRALRKVVFYIRRP